MVIYTDIKYLTPDTQKAVMQLIRLLAAKGLNPKISQTYRDPAEQQILFAKSQELISQGKPPITKTKQSWHETGRAIDLDISPMTSAGGQDLDNVQYYLETARSLGFHTMDDDDELAQDRAAGLKLPQLWDWHHLEYRNGRSTWQQAYNEYQDLRLQPEVAEAGTGLGPIIFAVSAYQTAYDWLNNN